MKISVIVPYCNLDMSRIKGLDATIDSIDNQTFKDYESIFVEHCNSKDYQLLLLKYKFTKKIILEHTSGFNKSWCMNVAAREAVGEWLVFVDADMAFGNNYFEKALEWINLHKPKFFVGWNEILKQAGRDEPQERIVSPIIRTAGGVFWVKKDFFWSIGGMNENYENYGGEDNDFWYRANYELGGSIKRLVGPHLLYRMTHIYHHNAEASPDRLRHLNLAVEYPKEINMRLRISNLGKKEKPTNIYVDDLRPRKPLYREC